MSLLDEAVDFEQYNHPEMGWGVEGAGNSPQREFMSRAIDLKTEEVQGKTVLDVGCGTGWFLKECLDKGAALAVGLEPSKFADTARKLVPAAAILKETFVDYQSPQSSFDLISFIMSTEHLADLPAVLAKAHQLLKYAGTILVMAGDFEAFQGERFGYIVIAETVIPGKEAVVRTERPTSFGTTTDIVRSRNYWRDVAESVGLSVAQDKPVVADTEYVSKIPKYQLYENTPFMQIFRFTKPTGKL